MSRNTDRPRPPTGGVAPPAAQTTRNNEYFLPRDGIDREVITADICRYLGNDALVRPGHLEKGDRMIQGYYITAYRNLTSAMIESLKEDSQKWVEEKRRAQGAQGAHQMRYMDSTVRNPSNNQQHQQQQHMSGVTRDFPDQAQYNDHYSAGGQGGFGQYPPRDPGYAAPPPNAFPPREPVYADRQDPYGAPPRGNPQYAPAPYGQQPDAQYHATGMNRPQFAPAPAPQQPPYGDPMQISGGQYPPTSQSGAYSPQHAQQQYYNQPPQGAPIYDTQAVPPQAQSRDVFYGRGAYQATASQTNTTSDFVASPAGSAGHSANGLEQQYDPDPSRSRASATPTAPSTQAQMANSGTAPQPRRDHTREIPRDQRDRHYNSSSARR